MTTATAVTPGSRGRRAAWCTSPRIVSGFVVLSTKPAVAYKRGFGAGITRGELLLHELGHAMGLNHVSNAKQIMYPVIISRPKAAYGVGDLDRAAAGRAHQGCLR